MPEFQFTATDVNRQLVQGTMVAYDKQDLFVRLLDQGLFLATSEQIGEAPAAPLINTPSVPDQTAPPLASAPSGNSFFDLPGGQLTAKHKWVFAAILSAGVLIGIVNVYRERHSTGSTDVLNKKIQAIETGMKRADLERILTQKYPGPQNPSLSRYFIPPYFIIEIQYDEDGGPGSSLNRMVNSYRIVTGERPH